MKRAAWNLSAGLLFAAAGLGAVVLARRGEYLALLLVMGGLATLSWGFYPRRYAGWRRVVGWAYSGLSLGILGGLGGQGGPFWLLAVTVVLVGVALLMLPSIFNGLFWTAALWRLRPALWSGPAAQGFEDVLAASPFTLHEVTKVTEQRSGGASQRPKRTVDRLECRYRGECIQTDTVQADLEDWVLARYRQYRRLRRLAVAPELRQQRELTHEEERPIEALSSPQWASSGELPPSTVLASSPLEVWVRFLGSADHYRVYYCADPEQPDHEDARNVQREFQTDFERGSPCTSLTMAEVSASGWIIESATLRLGRSNRNLSGFADLDSAEAEIIARYRAGRSKEPQT